MAKRKSYAFLAKASTGTGKTYTAMSFMLKSSDDIAFLSSRYSSIENAIKEFIAQNENKSVEEVIFNDVIRYQNHGLITYLPKPSSIEGSVDWEFYCVGMNEKDSLREKGFNASTVCKKCSKKVSCPLLSAKNSIKGHLFCHSSYLTSLSQISSIHGNVAEALRSRTLILDEDVTDNLLGEVFMSFKLLNEHLNDCLQLRESLKDEKKDIQELTQLIESLYKICQFEKASTDVIENPSPLVNTKLPKEYFSQYQYPKNNCPNLFSQLSSNLNLLRTQRETEHGLEWGLEGISPSINIKCNQRIVLLDATADEEKVSYALGRCGHYLAPENIEQFENPNCAQVLQVTCKNFSRNKLKDKNEIALLSTAINRLMLKVDSDGAFVITYKSIIEELLNKCPWLHHVEGKHFGGQIVGDNLIGEKAQMLKLKRPLLFVIGEPRLAPEGYAREAYRRGFWKSGSMPEMTIDLSEIPWEYAGINENVVSYEMKPNCMFKDEAWKKMQLSMVERELMQAGGRGYPRSIPTVFMNNSPMPNLPINTVRCPLNEFLDIDRLRTICSYSNLMRGLKLNHKGKPMTLCKLSGIKPTGHGRSLAKEVLSLHENPKANIFTRSWSKLPKKVSG